MTIGRREAVNTWKIGIENSDGGFLFWAQNGDGGGLVGWCKPESLHQECLESSGASRLDAAERGDDDDDGGDDDNDGGDADDDDAVGHVIVSINVCMVNRFEDLWIHEVVLWIYKMTQTENIEKIVNHGIPVENMNIGK